MYIFGRINEKVELINREKLLDGTNKTIFKFGKLTVVGTSNQPSLDAISRLGDGINKIAEKYISI